MDGVAVVFNVAMAVLVLAVPLALTCLVVALLQAGSRAGLANGAPLPSGAMARADETFERVRVHFLRAQLQPSVSLALAPGNAAAEQEYRMLAEEEGDSLAEPVSEPRFEPTARPANLASGRLTNASVPAARPTRERRPARHDRAVRKPRRRRRTAATGSARPH